MNTYKIMSSGYKCYEVSKDMGIEHDRNVNVSQGGQEWLFSAGVIKAETRMQGRNESCK